MTTKMRTLKWRVLFMVGMLFSTVCLMALDTGIQQKTPESEAKRRTQRFTKTLKLTDEQAERVSDMFLTFFTHMEETRNANLVPARRKEQVQKHVKVREKVLKEVLTPEQWRKLQHQRKREREARAKRNQ